ncbi:predicted protein [Streptomyces albidoflavus]|nr:predicted protein [Streptomyces albidoflavus]
MLPTVAQITPTAYDRSSQGRPDRQVVCRQVAGRQVAPSSPHRRTIPPGGSLCTAAVAPRSPSWPPPWSRPRC